MADTHISNLTGRIRVLPSAPASPVTGDEYYDKTQSAWFRYSGNNWLGFKFTKTTFSARTTTKSETPGTHFSSLKSKRRFLTADPSQPVEGDFYYDSGNDKMAVYENGQWSYGQMTTTTSTSSSTTTTSTSTTTTSTSSSTTTSSSTSTTSSTTTTL